MGRITQLDTTGIEVVVAVRSDVVGESITVCSGRGFTLYDAEDGALGEALERRAAEPRGRIATVTARYLDLPRAVAPTDLILDADVFLDEASVLDWVAGRSLVHAESIYVPANAVFFPYEASDDRDELFSAQTTGLAAGVSFEDAALRGVLECVERDALSVAVAMIATGHGAAIPGLRPRDGGARMGAAVERLERQGLRVVARDLTHDFGVPVAEVTLGDPEFAAPHFGVAADVSLPRALERAFLEAAQARAVWIQGAREDLPEAADRAHPFFLTEPSRWSSLDDAAQLPAAPATLEGLGERVARVLGNEPIVVDLSIEEIPFPVVRAVVPGAEVWALDRHRMGRRVARWLRER